MPPKNEFSLSSQEPRHSGSAASIKPSRSLSSQSPHPSSRLLQYLGMQASEPPLPPVPKAPPEPVEPPVTAGNRLFSPISTSSLHAGLQAIAAASSARHQLRVFMSTQAQGFVAFWTLRR